MDGGISAVGSWTEGAESSVGTGVGTAVGIGCAVVTFVRIGPVWGE